MRKVIKHGLLWRREHFPKYTKCPNCKCTFSFELEDVKYEEDAVFYPTYQYVNCPECYNICRDNESKWRIFRKERSDEV